jgi:hypothetical protein
MSNKYHGNLTGNGKYSGGPQSDKRSKSPDLAMPEKTASWPGLPGSSQGKSRAGGAPTSGPRGPFYVKKIGL